MSFVLGIDIGTSFSAAAVARLDGSGQSAPQVLNLGVRGGAVPSVIFLGEDGHVLVGEAAERRGTTHPDRLVREFKRRVGDAVPIVVGELCVAPEDIVATMARWVVDRAQEREGEPPAAVAIAHPASWGGYKRDLIRQALAGVGLSDVTLVSEPEAAMAFREVRRRDGMRGRRGELVVVPDDEAVEGVSLVQRSVHTHRAGGGRIPESSRWSRCLPAPSTT